MNTIVKMKSCLRRCLRNILIGWFIFKILNIRSFWRVLKFILKRYILRKEIPGVATLALTYRCQCHCVHCSVGAYQLNSEEMNIEEWKKIIDQLDRLGVPRVHISGGEPTLKEGFKDIVRYLCSKGMVVFLETNGGYLNEEIVRFLHISGVATVDISLDNINSSIHDKLRGLEGSFKKATEAIKICKKLKMPHMISTYATRDNIYSGELVKLVLFAKHLKVPAIRILPSRSSGRWLNNFDVASLEKKDHIYLDEQLPIYTVLHRYDVSFCPIKIKYTMFIAPDGLLYPCPHLPFSFGNILGERLGTILQRMSQSSLFDKKSMCYINDREFRDKFIEPILEKRAQLPIRIQNN